MKAFTVINQHLWQRKMTSRRPAEVALLICGDLGTPGQLRAGSLASWPPALIPCPAHKSCELTHPQALTLLQIPPPPPKCSRLCHENSFFFFHFHYKNCFQQFLKQHILPQQITLGNQITRAPGSTQVSKLLCDLRSLPLSELQLFNLFNEGAVPFIFKIPWNYILLLMTFKFISFLELWSSQSDCNVLGKTLNLKSHLIWALSFCSLIYKINYVMLMFARGFLCPCAVPI